MRPEPGNEVDLASVFTVYTFIASDTCMCTTIHTDTLSFLELTSTTKKIDIIVHNSPFLLIETGTDFTPGRPKPVGVAFQQTISFI